MEPFEESRLFYYWKGRVALYTILKAMGIDQGDEIIIPGYTCVAVANPVSYLGAVPIYADIDPNTYNITPKTIEPLISAKTKAIIAQNTYGLSPDLDAIMALAAQHDLYVIEDCAHGLGSGYKGRPAGTNTHAAFFSTQWSKPISTGIGGIAYITDDEIKLKVRELTVELSQPRKLADIILALQRLLNPLADNPQLYYALVDSYRFLTQKMGVSVGSSTGDELTSPKMPDKFLKGMGKWQRKSLDKNAQMLTKVIQNRRKVSEKYDAYFKPIGQPVPHRPKYAEHAMLRYSIWVENKSATLAKAKRLRIPIGDWFVSPLHPVNGDLTLWGYHNGMCPVAENACAHVVNLSTDNPLSNQQLSDLFEG